MCFLKAILPLLFLVLIAGGCSDSRSNNVTKNISQNKKDEPVNIYDISVKTMEGKDKKLSDYKGKVLMIVNVASKCGNTPQYEALENIYEKYKDKGFEILAFPCNDFGGQEPGTNDEIRTFCESKYNVTFPLFDKIKVLGDEKSPLFAKLIRTEPQGDVKWNFEKFIIDKEGNSAARIGNKVNPSSNEVTSVIEEELAK